MTLERGVLTLEPRGSVHPRAAAGHIRALVRGARAAEGRASSGSAERWGWAELPSLRRLVRVHVHEPRARFFVHVGVVDVLVDHVRALRAGTGDVLDESRHLLDGGFHGSHAAFVAAVLLLLAGSAGAERAHDLIHVTLNLIEDALERKDDQPVGHHRQERADEDELDDDEEHHADVEKRRPLVHERDVEFHSDTTRRLRGVDCRWDVEDVVAVAALDGEVIRASARPRILRGPIPGAAAEDERDGFAL